jgi:hypothetical protein
MADWPIAWGWCPKTYGSARASVQSGNNTKSAWTEVIASTPFDGFVLVNIIPAGSSATYLVDIGIGGSGSEISLISDILIDFYTPTSFFGVARQIFVPIFVPAGSRLSFRSASYGGSDWTDCALTLVQAGGFVAPTGLSRSVTYGAVTGDSGGTAIDPGASADTKGSWVQLTSGADFGIKGLAIALSGGLNANMTSCEWYIDIGLTSSPGDAVVIADYFAACREESDLVTPFISPVFPVFIPAGEEIHMRASCTINDATDRVFDAVIYCFG